jgi:hypothetical protein
VERGVSTIGGARQLEMVKLNGRGTKIMIWLYFVTLSALAIWSLDEVRTAWPTFVGLALFAVVSLALSLDSGETLSPVATAVTVLTWPVVAVLLSWQLFSGGGFSQWFLGAGTATLFLVSLRGRILWAWFGFVLMSSVILVWGATTDIGVMTAGLLVAKQAPILVVGTLFAIGLRRTGASIQNLSTETSARSAIEAADVAATLERNRRLSELDAFATPLLTLLVSGTELTDRDRREFAVAEAELRDGLRARTLSVPPIVEAARAARRRGVDVVLLDDSDPDSLAPHDLAVVIDQVEQTLRDTDEGRVVARLLPADRDGVATVLVDSRDGATTAVIPASAEPARTQ